MGRRTGTVLLCVIAGVALALPASASADSLIVNNASITPTEGQLFNGPVATFSDSPGGFPIADYSASIGWGDGTTSAADKISGSDSIGYAVTGSHIYNHAGNYLVTVTINGFTTSSTIYDVAQVADAPLTPSTAAPATFSGTGPSGALNSLNAFAAAIGGRNNGTTPAPQSGGYRHVTWDDVTLGGGDPGSTVINPNHTVQIARNREQAAGLELAGPLAVSGDGFTSVNPNVSSPTRFPAFSGANVFAPFNTNTVTLNVVEPSSPGTTPTPAATRGLGLVFLNVRLAETTIAYLNGSSVLRTVTVPVGGEGVPVFSGLLYSTPAITGVRITFGGGPIFGFGGGAVDQANQDILPTQLVAGDDLVQAEPTAAAPNLGAIAGVPFSGQVDTFSDANPNAKAADFAATIDWGDGQRSLGAVTTNGSGGFSVRAGHTFAQAGSFPVTVTTDDSGGGQRVVHMTAVVSLRSTATTVSCAPNLIRVGMASVCTATVTDIAGSGASAPTGAVGFTSTAAGGFASGADCMLVVRGAGVSTCTTTFTALRTQAVVGSYSGDARHGASTGAGPLSVLGHGCTLGVPSPNLSARARTLRVLAACDENVTVKIAGTATIGRHGSRRGGKLSLGTAAGRVSANRAATLVLHPSARVLAALRSDARAHQPISLALSLTATASATTKTSLTVRSLKVS